MNALICTLIAYAIARTWESIGHRRILHAKRREATQWRHYGMMGKAMREARFNHLIHHKLMRTSSWSRERIKGSKALSKTSIAQLEETEFGETINPTLGAIVLFSGIPLALTIPLYLKMSPAWLPVGLFIALSPYLMTRYVHPYLHAKTVRLATGDSPAVHEIFLAAIDELRAYHAEHHLQPWKNFNLLIGADMLFSLGIRAISKLWIRHVNSKNPWDRGRGRTKRSPKQFSQTNKAISLGFQNRHNHL